jgi:hypothetical protein
MHTTIEVGENADRERVIVAPLPVPRSPSARHLPAGDALTVVRSVALEHRDPYIIRELMSCACAKAWARPAVQRHVLRQPVSFLLEGRQNIAVACGQALFVFGCPDRLRCKLCPG